MCGVVDRDRVSRDTKDGDSSSQCYDGQSKPGIVDHMGHAELGGDAQIMGIVLEVGRWGLDLGLGGGRHVERELLINAEDV